jgi:16S rRNA U1498 N3-methylase RsmE
MDCIYYPSFNNNNNYINIEHTFTNHLKALRIRLGDSLLITNGQGLLVKTTLMNETNRAMF